KTRSSRKITKNTFFSFKILMLLGVLHVFRLSYLSYVSCFRVLFSSSSCSSYSFVFSWLPLRLVNPDGTTSPSRSKQPRMQILLRHRGDVECRRERFDAIIARDDAVDDRRHAVERARQQRVRVCLA